MMALYALLHAGLLSVLDLELARGLCRMAGERREGMLLAVALLNRNLQQGHVCFDLHNRRPSLYEEARAAGVILPCADTMRSLALSSPLLAPSSVGCDQAYPLVLDDKNRLYFSRYHDHERAVADRLLSLARHDLPEPGGVGPWVDALFPPRMDGKPDLQRAAALSARTRRLSIIVGGPGTGKTSTVVKLLALLAYDARGTARPWPRVLLLAPTGKAAQRLTESIEQTRRQLAIEPEIAEWIPSAAQTVHRALGSIEGSSTQFRHNASRPLACEVLLLDEASMVDLALMRRLLDALPTDARVIMLGDPDQLVSVEAGGVLGDLCRAAERGGPLTASVSHLTQSHRYTANSGIAALSDAVRGQHADLALSLLENGDFSDIQRRPATFDEGLPRALLAEARHGYSRLKSGSPESKLAALSQFRVLAAHRKGRDGVDSLNSALSHALRSAAGSSGQHYSGRPVLITQNDYGTGLFNGDVGVLHAEGRRELSFYISLGDHVRRVAIGRLPAHETVYAMSIHKSQGSEFDRVAIVLPERASPVLTRELLFTAITRARCSVTIYASRELLRTAIEHRVERESGLADRLVD